jgi:hypothetical protein
MAEGLQELFREMWRYEDARWISGDVLFATGGLA